MGTAEFEMLRSTRLEPGFLEEYCSNPKLVGTEGLVMVAFDAINNEPTPLHGRCVEELGERLMEGLVGEYAIPALLALEILDGSDEWFVREPAKRALNAYYTKEFTGKLKSLEPETIVELLELGQDLHSPGQYSVLLDHIGKRAFREGFDDAQRARIAKVAAKLLCHGRQDVVFEAAFVLKELKEPSSYPHIIRKLKDKDAGLEKEVRRMLSAAAENIAMKVTMEVLEMKPENRGKDWTLSVFKMMRKNTVRLRELEKGPAKKLGG